MWKACSKVIKIYTLFGMDGKKWWLEKSHGGGKQKIINVKMEFGIVALGLRLKQTNDVCINQQ